MRYEMSVVLSDYHVPKHDQACHGAVMNFMKDSPVDRVITIGDFGDYESISHHMDARGQKRIVDIKTFDIRSRHSLLYEYDQQNNILDDIDEAAPRAKKTFIYGNHEDWVRQLMERDYDKLVYNGVVMDINEGLYLEDRGYEQIPYNDYKTLGHLVLTHGEYHNMYSARKHVEAYQKSVMYGHIHTVQEFTIKTKTGDVLKGKSIGCMCNKDPHYMRGAANGWAHAFAVVYTFPDGTFQEQTINIIDGKFVYNGKVYKA